MVNTYTGYLLLNRDMPKSLERVGKQPVVQRETEYYLANIGKVKTIDEFVNNHRLFNYAMKAHGLEDMAYAKAFMIKALKEGVSDPESFANSLTDKRYAEFVRSFNFAGLGENATTFNNANDGVTQRYLFFASAFGGEPSEFQLAETTFYAQNIGKVKSIDQLLSRDNERLLSYALEAFGLEFAIDDRDFIRAVLEGGVDDKESLANRHTDTRWLDFAKTFNFVGLGERTTTYNRALQPSVDKYLRQTLEEDAGTQNEGVRLSLYFKRKAQEITNAYQLLGDPALSKVVRTLLQLPEAIAQLDVDKQAKLIEGRIDLADFQDPEKLEKLVTRFAALWEVENPSSPVQSSIVTLFQPMEFGISHDTLMAIASMRR